MGRIVHILEHRKAMLGYQGQQAQKAKLVGRGNDHGAAPLGHADQFPHQRARVLQVLDYFRGHDRVGETVGQR